VKKVLVVFLLICLCLTFGCREKKPASESDSFSVLIFVTGVLAGSPPYELMAQGAAEFAEANSNVTVKVYEAGFNQAEWEEQLTDLVSSGDYDLVLGSNPSLPEICENAGRKFPNQKFVIVDAFYEGNPQISAYFYNQYEQSLYLGYLAGLITVSDMPLANSQKKIGFIAAQEYPLLTRHMVPGFLAGAKLADPQIELDRRIIGNWFDANKAAELASSMMDSGVDVFTSIAGGAARGLLRTAMDRGSYVVSYNVDEYDLAPGAIVGCGLMEQKKLVLEILGQALAGEIQYGVSKTIGIKEGYLDFIDNEPGYMALPAEIREKFGAFIEDMRAGRVNYTIPPL